MLRVENVMSASVELNSNISFEWNRKIFKNKFNVTKKYA